jgi:cob(I)alamin adenosyltransferase
MDMVKLTKIYTRGGDAGETSLVDGARVPKHDLRVAAFGTVDEANATLGLVRLHTSGEPDAMLMRIQNDLFDLGADLATPGKVFDKSDANEPQWVLRILQTQVDRLETEIDAMNAELAPLNSFVLPGGCVASAYLHLARTIVRRAERLAVEAAATIAVNPIAIKYLNRLSDHHFVMSRYLNDKGGKDVLWVPGANR